MNTTTKKFDASKLIAGKCYPIRSGGKACFIRSFLGCVNNDTRLAFFSVYEDDTESLFDTDDDGRQNPIRGESSLDILSDEPWVEPMRPIDVRCITPYVAVFQDGSTSAGFDSPEVAMEYAKQQRCRGIAEVHSILAVTPVSP